MSDSTGRRYVGMWRSDLGLKFGEIPQGQSGWKFRVRSFRRGIIKPMSTLLSRERL
jgi:hypothetical protein